MFITRVAYEWARTPIFDRDRQRLMDRPEDQVRERLKWTFYPRLTACHYYHRFVLWMEEGAYALHDVATVALFMVLKDERPPAEEHTWIEDLISARCRALGRPKDATLTPRLFMVIERKLLLALWRDLAPAHPHPFVKEKLLFRPLPGHSNQWLLPEWITDERHLPSKADCYSVLTDIYHTPLCLHPRPDDLAYATLALVHRAHGLADDGCIEYLVDAIGEETMNRIRQGLMDAFPTQPSIDLLRTPFIGVISILPSLEGQK